MAALDWSASPEAALIAGGKRLEYACFGPPPASAMTIVLLHEGLGCVALWRDIPERLAAATGMGVLAYSRQGYGQSDPGDLPRSIDFMTEEATEVLPEVLDVAGIGRTILMGHSDGATIAAIHAGSLIDRRVRGLVLIAPHFFTEPEGLRAIEAARQEFEGGDLRAKLARYHRNPDNAFRTWADTWLDPAFEEWNVAEVIDYFRIPTLAIQGREDQYGTLAQIEEIEARSYAPVDMLVVDDCRHTPHLEVPERVLTEIAEFAARLERIEAARVETA